MTSSEEQKVLNDESKNSPAAVAPAAGFATRGSNAAQKAIPEDAMIIVPMRNTVLFPGVISPITVGRPGSVAAAQEAVRSERKIGFLLQRDSQKDRVKPEDLYWVGTSGQVVRYITGAEGATLEQPNPHHVEIIRADLRDRDGLRRPEVFGALDT